MLISRRGFLAGVGSSLVLPHSRAHALAHGLVTQPTHGLIIAGDSRAGCDGDYPYQALGNPETGDCGSPLLALQQVYYSRLTSSVPLLWRNLAISGTRLDNTGSLGFPNLTELAPQLVNPVAGISPFKGLKLIFINAIGVNDICIGSFGNGNADQYAAAMAALNVSVKNAWVALGATCVTALCTIYPSSSNSMTQANWTQSQATMTGAGWATANDVDLIIDLNSQARIGVWGSLTDPQLSSDGLHLTAFGNSLLVPIFLAGVNTLIGML